MLPVRLRQSQRMCRFQSHRFWSGQVPVAFEHCAPAIMISAHRTISTLRTKADHEIEVGITKEIIAAHDAFALLSHSDVLAGQTTPVISNEEGFVAKADTKVKKVHVQPERPIGLRIHHFPADQLRVSRFSIGGQIHMLVLAGINFEAAIIGEGRIQQP
jgi:hypothetical protein